MSDTKLSFTGYEPRPVLSAKLTELLEKLEKVEIDIAKLKLAGESKKPSKPSAE